MPTRRDAPPSLPGGFAFHISLFTFHVLFLNDRRGIDFLHIVQVFQRIQKFLHF